jgi:hypothetical protein
LLNKRLARSKFTVVGVGLFASATLVLSACNDTKTTPIANSSSAATVSPATALTNAIAQLQTTGYDVSLTQEGGQLNGNGSVDPGKSASMDAKGTIQGQNVEIHGIQVGSNVYLKVDLGALGAQFGIDPSKWIKIDLSKVTKPLFDMDSGDAFDVSKLMTAVSGVTATDAQHISGTVDLSKATGVNAPDSSELSSAGDAAKSVKFDATLDDKGRLIELKLTTSSASLNQDIKISNYGSPTPVTAPTDAVPAPAAIYQFLNG